ncbi:TetR/AcrR family transcriptional regulator [Gordonia sp. HY002]|uniref:TetR/AcrR family transcriptional regulator n=1 Tax=Gordonia zhenghanii TaxID=2911516 RepID=UPI001EEFF9B6|nr:TetR/AcrR family transcriptional regulator [Gordonia zhenghanii]MCF8569069.1 TetR/AcrR family transcriptional regulator [Gordonia zhenghanii]MCF8605221.1 TetR/AcrR family transcriptional regulator [Gordonia zhenghanii]
MMSPRAEMVAQAADLIARKGVAGTSIGDVLAAADASRGSVYHHFPGGRSEILAEAVLYGADRIDDGLAQAARSSPAYLVADIADMWRRMLADTDFAAGNVVSAAATARETDPAIADIAERQFVRWEDGLAASLRSRGVDGDRSRSLAVTTLAAIEGAVVLCRAHRSLEPLEHVVGEIGPLLSSAG